MSAKRECECRERSVVDQSLIQSSADRVAEEQRLSVSLRMLLTRFVNVAISWLLDFSSKS